MFKRMLFLFATAAVMLSACGTLDIRLDQTPTPDSGQTPVAAATLTVKPAPTATKPSVTEPATADASLPMFTNVKFYWTPEKHGACAPIYRVIFPAYIRRVRTQWDYANMKAGLIIRREWYHDGELWSQADELWDFAKYGANGTVDDSYIYDFDAGLKPGHYELRLFISSQPQFGPEIDKHSFTVDKKWSLEIASPNGLTTAIIAEPDKLKLRAADSTTWELIKTHEITSLAWFTDSQHIVYADTEWPQTEGCSSFGIRHTLWLINASTSTQQQIGRDEQNLRSPLLSPGEKYIATISGSGYGDACGVELSLLFIELDNKLQQFRSFRLQDFAGIPAAAEGASILPATVMGTAHWRDATHFETTLTWTCPTGDDPSGIYSFDLENKQVTRIGDLPK